MAKIIFLISFLFFFSFKASSDEGIVEIVGWVLDFNDKPVRGAIVSIYEDGELIKQTGVNRRGRFVEYLFFDKNYTLEVTGPGYVSKKLSFDTYLSEDETRQYHEFVFVVELFEEFPGLELEVMKEPLATVSFRPVERDFNVDMEKLKILETKMDSIQKHVSELFTKRNIYNSIIKDADSLYRNEEFLAALDIYYEAYDLKLPAEEYSYTQVRAISQKLGIPTREQVKYNEFIAAADSLFDLYLFDEAVEYYSDALNVKPDKDYPQQRIIISERLLNLEEFVVDDHKIVLEELPTYAVLAVPLDDEDIVEIDTGLIADIIYPDTTLIAEYTEPEIKDEREDVKITKKEEEPVVYMDPVESTDAIDLLSEEEVAYIDEKVTEIEEVKEGHRPEKKVPGIVNFFDSLLFKIFALIVLLVILTSKWKVFVKAGKPGWAALIPVYNIIVLLDIVRKPLWWTVLVILFPFIFMIWVLHLVSKRFDQGLGFTIGLVLLPFIFIPILGFGSAEFKKV